MIAMRCGLLFSTLLLASVPVGAVQTRSVLHIKVVVADAEGRATPVPRHVLLISDNPATAPPRRVVTGLDGTADAALTPGNYTIESDRPFILRGKAYQWTQTVDVVAGRDGVLELTGGNADAEPAAAAGTGSVDADASAVLAQWQKSVLALWTPTTHASGFVIDSNGLMLTSGRVVGAASSVEVEIAPSVKVAARVLAADAARDIAVLWVDSTLVAAVPPVPLPCGQPPTPIEGQPLFTIATPLRGQKRIESGTVSRIEPHAIIADFTLATGSAGGPAFSSAGAAIGVTTAGEQDEHDPIARIVRLDYTCAVIAEARSTMKGAPRPDGTHLPVESDRGAPVDALKEMVRRRAGSLNPYTMSSPDFDVAFITPVMIYASQYQSELAKDRERRSAMRTPQEAEGFVRPLMDFRNWSGYVDDLPPVLLVRVTPRLVEGFWTTVARGAARTQGVSLPPIKHFKSGFARLRAFCGSAEVTPIHPFKLEQRVSEDDAIYEGLYAFDPAAFGPHCVTAKLILYSDKAPDKGDARPIDARVLEQIWQDFAPYRR